MLYPISTQGNRSCELLAVTDATAAHVGDLESDSTFRLKNKISYIGLCAFDLFLSLFCLFVSNRYAIILYNIQCVSCY